MGKNEAWWEAEAKILNLVGRIWARFGTKKYGSAPMVGQLMKV